MSLGNPIQTPLHDEQTQPPFLRKANRRLLTILGLLVTVMLFGHPAALSGAAGCFLFFMLWSGISIRHICKRLLLIVPFGLGAVAFIPFQGEGTPLFHLWVWTATEEGVGDAAVILLKIVCANLLITYLMAVTPLFDLIKSLRTIGFPSLFIEMMALMMRYFFLLREEAASMLKAQRSRGMKIEGWLWDKQTYKRFGELLGVLFLRAYRRSERIYQSISARGGFAGGVHEGSGSPVNTGEIKKKPQEGRVRQMAIDVRNAVYRYGEIEALRGVSFTIERGAKAVLMGPNGAGKSTLISLLNGLEQPSRGEVFVLGEQLTRESGVRLRQRVGVVYQDPDDQIFSTTVEEDVAFGPRNLGLSEAEVGERVDTALGSVGMRELRKRSPFELSYGQKRRVAIAGVLAMRPEIIILDEPMAFLDPKSRDDLHALLETMHLMGITLVVATHDVDFAAEWADQVLILVDGRMLASGTTELLFDDSLLAEADLHLPRLVRPFRLLQGAGDLRPRTVRQAAQLIWKLMVRGPEPEAEELTERRAASRRERL
ncbi:cobalt ECF transporter T component CbiQ [Paenibacillus sp. sptzw28]|uniref:cobalt ECF transporter T component CbiQ n=1 Tax=Paenibacillus sp. sptzw28 TaxID=715179 RepID=UPI001C6EB42F|nr:cobalt ECF transporter T component CbiQ [Paenibacillus sp. sptzw28]QYR21660.1 cobalt ECF transporter T component CbiQ [Paenibacillus sp. sptzw28]